MSYMTAYTALINVDTSVLYCILLQYTVLLYTVLLYIH